MHPTDEVERSSAPFASKIGGGSGLGRDSGGDAGELSPGASKPATHGRFKTSHHSWGFRTRLLTLTGSASCSKYQTSTGLLIPHGAASLGPAVRPLSKHP